MNLRIYCFLYFLLLAACTQSDKVPFPLQQREYLPPKTVKATPSFHSIPDNLPQAQYIREKGSLIKRNLNTPLQKPQVRSIIKSKAISIDGFKPYLLPENMPQARYIWNPKQRKLLERNPNTPILPPKTYPVGTPKTYTG